MQQESKDIIIKNFITLMKECDVQVLKDPLIEKKVFSSTEIDNIFSTPDERHNKRVFFFNIQKKKQNAFNKLVESLKDTNQHKVAEILSPGVAGIKPFCFPPGDNNKADVSPGESVELHVNPNTSPLNVQVELSNEFLDTTAHNKALQFYNARSKKRGRLLIINNYEYVDSVKYEYRNGAKVDDENLHKLFNQMGGWEILQYNNLTGEEMKIAVTQFSNDTQNNQYDICFVIIMGHGDVHHFSNETIIYGKDGIHMSVTDVQKHFTNEKCKGFRGKPKVFLFQVCRGDHLDYTIQHTETDSARRPNNAVSSTSHNERLTTNIRSQEDMLIGYATLNGYKAHRDPYRGSWYIELICKNFMKFAHAYTVGDLLQLVDQGLAKRMSEDHTMQTAEHNFRGFRRLYLNPGIYFEDGIMKRYNDELNM